MLNVLWYPILFGITSVVSGICAVRSADRMKSRFSCYQIYNHRKHNAIVNRQIQERNQARQLQSPQAVVSPAIKKKSVAPPKQGEVSITQLKPVPVDMFYEDERQE